MIEGTNTNATEAALRAAGVRRQTQLWVLGPLVVHGNPEQLPEWMPAQVNTERLEIALIEAATGKPEDEVGPTEIAAVLHDAMLSVRWKAEITDLYLWACASAVARYNGSTVDEVWQTLGLTPVPDEDVVEPEGRLFRTRIELCAEIRRRVAAAARRRLCEVEAGVCGRRQAACGRGPE